MGWRLWVGATLPLPEGQGAQSPSRTHLPVSTSGGAGPEPFPHHPPKLRTLSLRRTLWDDSEVGFKVTFSPVQRVEGGPLLLRAALMKTQLPWAWKAHCLWP